jgi:DNA-binding LacI/PurR family transcriptional regulator
MHKLGLAAPGDYAIVGFNNIEASGFSDPPLSTLDQDFDYLGRTLLRSARALGRGEVEQASEPPSHRLLVRASCGGADRLDAALIAELAKLGLTVALAGTPAREAVASHP